MRKLRKIGRRLQAWGAYVLLVLSRQIAKLAPNLDPPKSWLPALVGRIAGKMWAPAIVIADSVFGYSMTIPTALKIRIDGSVPCAEPKALLPVAAQLFAGQPSFNINVAFSCGRTRWRRRGLYVNPRSQWFNVFCGYYEITVAKSAWGRPFGYARSGTGALTVDPAEIAQLGRADWHYFSNHMYGVPLVALKATGSNPISLNVLGPTTIGARTWDHVAGSGLRVASAYVAKDDLQLEGFDHLNFIWRAAFGRPFKGRDPKASFIPTFLRAELYASYADDSSREKYRTYIFGGTVNDSWADGSPDRLRSNDMFLELQMCTIRQLIAKEFSDLGFA